MRQPFRLPNLIDPGGKPLPLRFGVGQRSGPDIAICTGAVTLSVT